MPFLMRRFSRAIFSDYFHARAYAFSPRRHDIMRARKRFFTLLLRERAMPCFFTPYAPIIFARAALRAYCSCHMQDAARAPRCALARAHDAARAPYAIRCCRHYAAAIRAPLFARFTLMPYARHMPSALCATPAPRHFIFIIIIIMRAPLFIFDIIITMMPPFCAPDARAAAGATRCRFFFFTLFAIYHYFHAPLFLHYYYYAIITRAPRAGFQLRLFSLRAPSCYYYFRHFSFLMPRFSPRFCAF